MADNILTSDDIVIIQMALTTFIEDNAAISKDTNYNFNPTARKALKDMHEKATSALEKLKKFTNFDVKLGSIDDITPDDAAEFLTKES